MLFNSLTFLVFFVVVFALHARLRGWSARKNVLLVASYLFYAAWNPPYVVILIFSTVLDWWLARRLDQSLDPKRRKLWLVLSLVGNLGLLAYFKYGGFVLENFQTALAVFGVHYSPPFWGIVLPVGISFYTFASLSYTIDVYRREIPSDGSLRDYALFVSFFPHLVAGPIVRASVLLPQMKTPRVATTDQVCWGLVLVFIGLFGKSVLADAMFAPIADQVFSNPAHFGVLDTWIAVFAFSAQIYFDFSAYSLCAIGLALCFGFEFPDNFRFPYAAVGLSDFWRRWHISLSTWLRDYLYIPLGGNRRGETRTRINLMLTMLVGGLWHGASWLFVGWGALHGLYLVIGRIIGDRWTAGAGPIQRHVLMLATFLLVSLTWIPFRAETLAQAGGVLQHLITAAASPSEELTSQQRIAWLLGIVGMLRWQMRLRNSSLEAYFATLSRVTVAAWLSVCVVGVFLFSGGDGRAFIYFQF